MKRIIISFGWLMAACVAIAGTGTSNEFRLDCRTGVRTAALTEKIQYSTAWATNLTAAQQGEAKAVVKVNPCLKTPPKYLVVDMSGGRSAARWPVSYLDEVPSGGWTDEYKTEKLVLRYIPAGSFIMGGRATDYPGAVNTNLHMVTLTKPFYIGVFECTQRQWELAMGTRPSWFSNETCYAARPVEQVSYADVRGDTKGLLWPKSSEVDGGSFMGVLRSKVGNCGFDLPTEAQWEYVCRAGTKTALNNNTNLSVPDRSPEVLPLGRVAHNCGRDLDRDDRLDTTYRNWSDNKGTASVGSYIPNAWGLYDMHGNIYEWCADRWCECPIGTIDPQGPTEGDSWAIKGGSWYSGGYAYISGWHYATSTTPPHGESHAVNTVGFRICLHDATVYPSADSATVLINASGAAAADWTPTRAVTYQLTHEVQVDGVTVAPMESALFKVEGPELKIVPMGELTNGVAVKVEKVGGGGEWTVYYSLDGSEPTAGSTRYEGPFALPESATVKAVAISSSGVSSEVASRELALHPALAVEDTKARQRYPWNGKVDIDCEITGDETKKYAVTFSVEDEIGHTNLPIRTVGADVLGGPLPQNNENALDGGSGVPGGHALPFVLSPGKYRFVWDAAADLPKGTRFGGVSVSIDAVPSPLADWKRVVEITVDGYAGSETLTDVPVLVRLSSAIEGFDYADFAAPDTGADMIFTDMEGVARYPYEIDEWHQDGESLVWVKLPQMANGTKFKMAYGGGRGATALPGGNGRAASPLAAAVWSDYAGVWHMNEDSGTAFDSTEHGLDALPSCGTNKLADVSQMVAYENGACGRARVNATVNLVEGQKMIIPSYDALQLGSTFVFSGWFFANDIVEASYPKLVFRSWHAGGWGIELCRNPEEGKFSMVGGAGAAQNGIYFSGVKFRTPIIGEWKHVTAVYNGESGSFYENGILLTNGTITAANDNNKMIVLGGGLWSLNGQYSFNGQYDEIRLRGGSLSADRIKADYDMIANRDFCTYGKVGKWND